MMKMSELDWAAWVLVVLGALNWAMVGLFEIDCVQIIFGTTPWLMRGVYILIGASGAYWLYKMLTMKR